MSFAILGPFNMGGFSGSCAVKVIGLDFVQDAFSSNLYRFSYAL